MKILIDTNILLDLVLKREHYKEAVIILNSIEEGLFEGVVLDISLLNIDYIAKKQVKEIRDFLKLLNNLLMVVGATNKMIKLALELNKADLEDNLQYICAREVGVKSIITNDKNFYSPDIEVINSVDFIKKHIEGV